MAYMEEQNEKYPEGHFIGMWMGIGIAIGSGLGVPLAIAIGNPGFFGIGIPIGLAIGLAIGSSIEAKYKKEGKLRPLTLKEKKQKKLGVMIGVALLVIGMLTFLFFYLSSRGRM
jgi:MFS family permease